MSTSNVCMTPEEALASLRPEMIDVSAARSWVLQRLSPSGGICPECDELADELQQESWRHDLRIKCRKCGRFYSNRSGTEFEGCKLTWQGIYLVLVLIGAGFAPDIIAERVNVHPRTIKRLQRRILVAP